MLWLKRNKATNKVVKKNRLKSKVLTKSKLNSDRKVTVAAHSLAARLLANASEKKATKISSSVSADLCQGQESRLSQKGWQISALFNKTNLQINENNNKPTFWM